MDDEPLDLAWGAAEIAEVLGRTERQARHLIDIGAIKSVRRVGNRFYAPRRALRREFGDDPEAA
jgi:hypothetical protein